MVHLPAFGLLIIPGLLMVQCRQIKQVQSGTRFGKIDKEELVESIISRKVVPDRLCVRCFHDNGIDIQHLVLTGSLKSVAHQCAAFGVGRSAV